MKVEDFVAALGADFFTGVPDSQLKALCDYLMGKYGIDPAHHVIAANEGNCVALAAGYHLATGRVPVVYMQNSGEGNVINPLASLLNEKVYAIPEIFVIGWRGEPGVKDEPQHVWQGAVTLPLLDVMGVPYFVLDTETTLEQLGEKMAEFRGLLTRGKDVAIVVRKGALSYAGRTEYKNNNPMRREEIIRHIITYSGDDPIVSTTGKASRELFEAREAAGQGGQGAGQAAPLHGRDFLTVGSMGHSSSIALGIALNKPDRKIWCVDGDGAALMHLGALSVIASCKPGNLIHVVINNGAHESVGGMPTVASALSLKDVALACGYPVAVAVSNFDELDRELEKAKAGRQLTFIEAKCAIGARDDLGRPTSTPQENKAAFMKHLE